MRTGLVGYCCAEAIPATTARQAVIPSLDSAFMLMRSSSKRWRSRILCRPDSQTSAADTVDAALARIRRAPPRPRHPHRRIRLELANDGTLRPGLRNRHAPAPGERRVEARPGRAARRNPARSRARRSSSSRRRPASTSRAPCSSARAAVAGWRSAAASRRARASWSRKRSRCAPSSRRARSAAMSISSNRAGRARQPRSWSCVAVAAARRRSAGAPRASCQSTPCPTSPTSRSRC